MPTSNNPQIESEPSSPPTPRKAGGDLHSVVRAVEEALKKLYPSASDMETRQQELYKHAYSIIGKKQPLSSQTLLNEYNQKKNIASDVITRSQMERAAGVASKEPGVGTGPEEDTAAVKSEQNTPESGTDERSQPVTDAQPDGRSQKMVDSAGGVVPRDVNSVPQEINKSKGDNISQSSGGDDLLRPEQASTHKSDKISKKTSKEKSHDVEDTSNSPDYRKAESKPDVATEKNKPEKISKGKGGADASTPDAKTPESNSVNSQVQQAQRIRDSFREGGHEGAKQAVKMAASEGADKAFKALLEASEMDFGIITIGFAGTALLVLGHMFDVQLKTWEKWVIILYDAALFILLLLIVVFVLALYCNVPPPLGGMLSSGCAGFTFWNTLF